MDNNRASPLISTAELAQLIEESNVRLVDCRFDLFDADKGAADYEAGHIQGAVYAHMDHDLASEIGEQTGRHPLPDPARFQAALERWGINNDTHLIAYDYGNGTLAVRFWWMMRFWLGHERVAVLDGGIAGWTAAGQPLETGITTVKRANYGGVPNPGCLASTAEIEAAVRSGSALALIDARDPARFNGEVEPIDPVAGHIPGAFNMPLAGNLDTAGYWQSPDVLRESWQQAPVDPATEDVIVMCGSGVTACHLILSAVRAGLPPPRLYVGSWSEWIRDPGRPIAGSKRG